MESKEKLTFDQIVAVLKELEIDPELLDNELWVSGYTREEMDALEEAVSTRLGEYEDVPEGATGGMDEGSGYQRVYLFKDHGVFVAVTGHYNSYSDTSYNDDFEEVHPVTKTVTVYE